MLVVGEPVRLDRVRLPKTAEVVAQALRAEIVRGDIPEGGALPSEAELMERFGVSRPSLREAFRILETERLIEIRRGARGGARATRPDIALAARYLGLVMQFDQVTLKDVFVARAMLEPLGFHLLATCEDRTQSVALLRRQLTEFDRTETGEEFTQAWLEFFRLLFARAGNQSMKLVYGALVEVIGSEMLDALAMHTGSPKDNGMTRRGLERALTLAAAGKGAEAARFWNGKMLEVSDLVGETHSGRTLVEVTEEY
jgi:DNA-binding FadR family transcriptional regulator